ncbi:MAG TPA: type II secretion system F family protein [Povalibacter sp.]|uniref:type II secretion system F family protein n=1 Tax=Povalibacter sp. TaxID=1962978 RepID=UPI002C040E4B|nr:type II secretion system F family protein [Povalibacter sp.]HMN46348.1 type II secretion system F family protein [Povalibacter sp.]
MNAVLASLLTALACALILLLPLALRRRSTESAQRDAAWRDELPPLLRALRPAFRWYATEVDQSLPGHKREVMQTQLNAGGLAYVITPAEFLVVRRLAFIAGIAVALYVIFVLDVNDPMYIVVASSLAPFAYMYPDLWLRDTTKRRQMRFEKDFPFFLDVLVLGMKAGLTFTAAIEQAIDQLREGPVRQEFSRYLRETRTGVTRRIALDRVAARVMIPAVTNFVASVTQAEETGGSLGEVLADQARQRRQERFLRAEKLANQAPVKMLFPLIALLFPITFIIIGFPIVIQLIEAGAFDVM